MNKQQYIRYLKSVHWIKTRWFVLKYVRSLCERCGGIYKLNVHHKTYEHLGHEKLEDLEVLCRECHARQHERPPWEIVAMQRDMNRYLKKRDIEWELENECVFWGIKREIRLACPRKEFTV